MGHSTIKLTLDMYEHLMKNVNKEAADRLGEVIFSVGGSKMVTENKKGLSS